MTSAFSGRFGPLALERGYRLRLYAPAARRVDAIVDGRTLPMERRGDWFAVDDPSAHGGSRYAFAADGRPPIPDPGSRFQPDGVHAASEIVASRFIWPDDGWRGRPWPEHVIYELHVGAFTFEGTYESAAAEIARTRRARRHRDRADADLRLSRQTQLGLRRRVSVRAVSRATANPTTCGASSPPRTRTVSPCCSTWSTTTSALKATTCTASLRRSLRPKPIRRGATAIDVTVPDVRAFFAENAAYWITEYRFDGLRLDATDAIVDPHAPAFLHRGALDGAAPECAPDRRVALVVENDFNDVALLDDGYDRPVERRRAPRAHVLATGETAKLLSRLPRRSRPMARTRAHVGLCVPGRGLGTPRRAARGIPSARSSAERVRVVSAESRPDRKPRVRRTAGATRAA